MKEMTASERQDQVSQQLWERIEYCKAEYDITFAEMMGILELIQMDIYQQLQDD